jgi:hypothetical protein
MAVRNLEKQNAVLLMEEAAVLKRIADLGRRQRQQASALIDKHEALSKLQAEQMAAKLERLKQLQLDVAAAV